MAVLERERRRSAAGELRVVLLLADPGIGKTHLARTFLERHRRTTAALSARAFPLGASESFGVWSQALEDRLRGLTANEVTALCGGYLDDLAALAHSVAAARGGTPAREPSRGQLLQGLAAALANLAARSPVVVFLDDAHVADASSWEALAHFGRVLRDTRLLVLAAGRPAELAANPAAKDVVLDLDQEGLLQRLPLGPLDHRGLRELAAEAIGEAPLETLVEWLDERSRGNPLFALDLLQALVEEGADLGAPALDRLPEDLAERVGSRVRGFAEPSVAVLQSLAVLAGRVEARQLASATGTSLSQLEGMLEPLLRSRLVAEHEVGGELTYELAHPLIQEAVYQQIGRVRRRALHRDAARALLAVGRLGAAAPHFARSADRGDDEAIDALATALRQVEERGAYREALSILDGLVRLIPRGDPRWLRVLEAMPLAAEWVVDHRADTDALLGLEAMRALDSVLAEDADPAARGAVKFRLASFLGWGTGAVDDAERACQEARELFARAGDSGSRLLAENELAWNLGHRGRYGAMAAATAHVAAEAAQAGEPFATLQAMFAGGHAAFARGRFSEAEPLFRESIALARAEGKLYRVTVGLTGLACSLAAEGRATEAKALLSEAKEENPAWREGLLPEWECAVHWYAGDLAAALAVAADSAAQGSGELSKRLALGVAFASLAAAEAGNTPLAERYARRVRSAFGDVPWFFFQAFSRFAEAFPARQRDEPGALEQLCSIADALLEVESPPFAALVLFELAEVAAERGDEIIAGRAVADLERVASEINRPLYTGLANVAAAASALSGGAPDEATRAARRGDQLLAATSCRAFRARALEQLGHALTRSDPVAAVGALTSAATLFDRCGAVWRRERVRRTLRNLGGRGRRAAVRGTGELSAREREVARLAAEGLTAREIGEQLFISRRTVETHLANAYAKLGVASKLELARRAGELPLNQ
jgi:DNA-binding CsgD family transcriptional regulator